MMTIKRFPNKQALSDMVGWYRENMVFNLKVTPSTKIASMGSCFAREIKNYLVANNYNYMQVEMDKRPWLNEDNDTPPVHASAAWERVYNVFTLQNILEYSFCLKTFDRLNDCDNYVVDLLRARVAYPSRQVAEEDIADHVKKSRAVLEGCEIFIFTLGLVEIWKLGEMVLGCSPFHYSQYNPEGDFKYYVTGYYENYESLCASIEILKTFNPAVKIIISVSPVHLCATHRPDTDILSASCYSKSVLRAVAEAVVRKYKNMFYFPSYEIATVASAILQKDIYPDGHHAGKEIIASIMDIFNKKCMVSNA